MHKKKQFVCCSSFPLLFFVYTYKHMLQYSQLLIFDMTFYILVKTYLQYAVVKDSLTANFFYT